MKPLTVNQGKTIKGHAILHSNRKYDLVFFILERKKTTEFCFFLFIDKVMMLKYFFKLMVQQYQWKILLILKIHILGLK